ncbi:protoporphyrinogen oxidase [Sulfobacillus thermosulfidooxidans]|uniref:protoporphyrinogen oxidase n=1 Tax=Sulfobacillus thermosulfidooxidans TaxID=28034 RepID=UPI0009EA0BA1|nr:protoporphyrinogen oxidase [Sulfobacillus thermosulfidooxidans]
MMRVALVGGGLTGLSTAYYLERYYPEVSIDLFEADDQLGGWVRTDTDYGIVLEKGPDSFLATKPDLVELCESVGLGPHLIGTNPRVRGAYVFWRDRYYPIPDGIQTGVPTKAKPVLTSPLLSLTGKMALAKDFIMSKGPTTDQSLGHFLRRRFGNQIVDRLAAPMLSGIFAGDIDQMSLKATFPHLLAAEQQARSVYLGSKRRIPPPPNEFVQRYHSAFLTVDRGLEQIIHSLASALSRTHVLLSEPVQHIEPATHQKWSVISAKHQDEYDAVIMTIPAYATAKVLPFLPHEAQSILQNIPYANLAVIGAAYDPEDIPVKTDKTGFLVPKQSGLRMTAVTWVSSKWHYPHVAPLFVLRAFYGRSTENILEYDDDTLTQLFYREMERTMHIQHPAQYLRVFRIPKGMPQYIVGHLERIAELHQYLARFPGLFVLGAFEGGVGMPDRVKQAKDIAQTFGQQMGLSTAHYETSS